jgi:hypothetical protein
LEILDENIKCFFVKEEIIGRQPRFVGMHSENFGFSVFEPFYVEIVGEFE